MDSTGGKTRGAADLSADRHQRWRMAKDYIARHAVAIGGSSVIVAILLIFFYLLYIVFPLFIPADARPVAAYSAPGGAGQSLYLAMDELSEVGVRYTADGQAVFFDVASGDIRDAVALLGADEKVSAFAAGTPSRGTVAIGTGDGRAVIARHAFKVSYPDDIRTVTSVIEFPYGREPVVVDNEGAGLVRLALRDSDDRMTLAGVTDDGRLVLTTFRKQTSFLTGEVTLQRGASVLPLEKGEPAFLLIDLAQQRLYAGHEDGTVAHYTIGAGKPAHVEDVSMVSDGHALTSLSFLAGGFSLLAGDSDGRIAQWFPVRDEGGQARLNRIRVFDSQEASVRALASEQRRKGFVAADADGRVGVYHSTAARTLLVEDVSEHGLDNVAISPRADTLLAEDKNGTLHVWHVDNEHPEVSLSSLWGRVWYEGYDEPEFIWQSSSASNDFEPKFSLTPLAFGTLKAAFYAMLVAVPLAIFGAVFTAYFMAPRMRKLVKPTVEIMEALPTVILGFLAGLWLAPFIEKHLPGVFAMLLVIPVGVLLFAYLWRLVPWVVRRHVPDGWEGALLVPVVALLAWAALTLSVPLEEALFGGNMGQWLTTELGINFDQRNAIVIGAAMGFAVIPTIFSITEDAIFSVPRHLTNGSLALGATPWQTLTRVVLLTASPGIFSAVMIGMGRAVGETMIVLMATGNTPVMDFSMFQGMRTLSANIAVEMPESEVGSTHYRVLFLAALVLFLFTFAVNTAAEVVRQRLRRKYSTL